MTAETDALRLVPVEPTREMWAAGGNAVVGYKQRHHDKVVEEVWSAMLAASPAVQPAAGREEIARLQAEIDHPARVGSKCLVEADDLRAILAALATQPAPSPGGVAYEDDHAVSVEMGYPSITEALEHLSELLEPAAPSIQKGGGA